MKKNRRTPKLKISHRSKPTPPYESLSTDLTSNDNLHLACEEGGTLSTAGSSHRLRGLTLTSATRSIDGNLYRRSQ